MLAESPFDTSWRLVGAECCPDTACACRLTAAKATSHKAGKKAVARRRANTDRSMLNIRKEKDRMSRTVVSAESVEKIVQTSAGELIILDGIDLEINQGETVAVVGASGSGKTTLLGILAGLDTATAGAVKLLDANLTDLDEEARALVRGQHVGFVFQSFQLLASLTALENVMLPVELRGDTMAQSQARELLEKVGLADRLDHYPRQLSGGEQQRVAIARAFASNPTVLFADEPTGNLDTQTGELICQLLFELNAEFGTTLVMVTHDLALAARCGRTISISGGRIVPSESQEAVK